MFVKDGPLWTFISTLKNQRESNVLWILVGDTERKQQLGLHLIQQHQFVSYSVLEDVRQELYEPHFVFFGHLRNETRDPLICIDQFSFARDLVLYETISQWWSGLNWTPPPPFGCFDNEECAGVWFHFIMEKEKDDPDLMAWWLFFRLKYFNPLYWVTKLQERLPSLCSPEMVERRVLLGDLFREEEARFFREKVDSRFFALPPSDKPTPLEQENFKTIRPQDTHLGENFLKEIDAILLKEEKERNILS